MRSEELANKKAANSNVTPCCRVGNSTDKLGVSHRAVHMSDDHGKDSGGDSSAAEEQKSLTSLNREMRMLIRYFKNEK